MTPGTEATLNLEQASGMTSLTRLCLAWENETRRERKRKDGARRGDSGPRTTKDLSVAEKKGERREKREKRKKREKKEEKTRKQSTSYLAKSSKSSVLDSYTSLTPTLPAARFFRQKRRFPRCLLCPITSTHASPMPAKALIQ